jgi:hypothetical protein
MSDIIKAAHADARRLLRYVRGAPTVDAERKLAAALLVQRAEGFKAAADECLELYFEAEFLLIDRSGHISKCGDRMMRHLLYEAASVLMT